MAFGETVGRFIGTPDKAFFYGIDHEHLRCVMPEIVFVIFQMTFAVIAPAIIFGAGWCTFPSATGSGAKGGCINWG